VKTSQIYFQNVRLSTDPFFTLSQPPFMKINSDYIWRIHSLASSVSKLTRLQAGQPRVGSLAKVKRLSPSPTYQHCLWGLHNLLFNAYRGFFSWEYSAWCMKLMAPSAAITLLPLHVFMVWRRHLYVYFLFTVSFTYYKIWCSHTGDA
jgi:hypothetical protein